jgi:hypothetical protein
VHVLSFNCTAFNCTASFQTSGINSALFSEILAVIRRPSTSWRRNAKTHIDQFNRDIGTVKFRANSLTLRANVDVYSLETVRSPALMWIFKPGVAPLSRAYPRLMNAIPSGLSRRFVTKERNS